ncbi:serine hydrolase domain-containing protein, partial [Ruminiclostridium cellobioparum]|uniref:serine hydrolase domain-containing protein n=1 Tax=Ruminiclostridium cellobioparum TaxID=29355 RepID=UPI0028A80D18
MFGKAEKEQLEKALRNAIGNKECAGANMMILKKGKEIFYHQDGCADLEEGLPVERDTIFRMYSMTKPVTAAAAMILLERGVIDLYEPVSKFLPGFKNQAVAAGDQLFS